MTLEDDDLEELGMTSSFQRRRVLMAIERLKLS